MTYCMCWFLAWCLCMCVRKNLSEQISGSRGMYKKYLIMVGHFLKNGLLCLVTEYVPRQMCQKAFSMRTHSKDVRSQVEGTSCVVTRCCCVWKCQPSQASLKSGAIFKVLISRKENVCEIESHFLSSFPAWWATKLGVIKVENNYTWRHLTIKKCLRTPTHTNKQYPTPPWC